MTPLAVTRTRQRAQLEPIKRAEAEKEGVRASAPFFSARRTGNFKFERMPVRVRVLAAASQTIAPMIP
jgi:hypothetical protein